MGRRSAAQPDALGELIRAYRRLANLQQPELAALLGVSKNAVSSWETGHTRPDLALIPPLCRALHITPSQLFGFGKELTADEKHLLSGYRRMDAPDRATLTALADQLLHAAQLRRTSVPKLVRTWRVTIPLAAGLGDPAEWADESMEIYLKDSPLARRTDYVFPVNGESMEPDFPSGCLVSVEALRNGRLSPGAIGAFQTENALYIKVYRPDGLYSLNPAFPPMLFADYEEIRLIGRVNGIIAPEDLATEEEAALFRELNGF